MKLVSPKTLWASLLGCAFVVLKAMTFDGFPDLFWILFIGYLSIKGLVMALSQEAYDEDVKQEQYVSRAYSSRYYSIYDYLWYRNKNEGMNRHHKVPDLFL